MENGLHLRQFVVSNDTGSVGIVVSNSDDGGLWVWWNDRMYAEVVRNETSVRAIAPELLADAVIQRCKERYVEHRQDMWIHGTDYCNCSIGSTNLSYCDCGDSDGDANK